MPDKLIMVAGFLATLIHPIYRISHEICPWFGCVLFCCGHLFYMDCVVHLPISWWLHQTETFSTLLAPYEGNPLVTVGVPSQRPVMRSFDVFFHPHMNKRLSKQLRLQWLEMPSCSLWRHCNILRGCFNSIAPVPVKQAWIIRLP